MQNRKTLLIIAFLFTASLSRGQEQSIVQNYINAYKAIAILEMQRSGIPASITLAQGIHETMAGTSDLVIESNNHFGIKCKDSWKGESVSHDDDAKGECFRKYESPADSYRDHSEFLKGSPRYASLFRLDPMNYTAWAYGLKKAGYATNPKYPVILIKLIEDYNLQDYTLMAMGKKPMEQEIFAKADMQTSEAKAIPAAVVTVEESESAASVNVAVAKRVEYPEGEFKINETRVIYVEKGRAFLSIAQQYNISLSRLFDFNDLSETEVLGRDELIYLQRKRKTGVNEFHTVNPGETLHDIAQEEGIRMESLLEYNLLQSNMQPAIGQQLYLRSKAPERPALAIGNSTSRPVSISQPVQNVKPESITLKVQPRETIYSISKKYNVKIDDLVQWNQLTSYNLKTGQQLRIYK